MLTLAQARTEATQILAQAKLGGDPQQAREDRREGDKLRVKALIDDYLTERKSTVRRKTSKPLRPATMRGLRRYLAGDYFKVLHAMPN